ncbi:hypothetical protein H0H92_014259, partial [Tricholoma furcatifolium]
PETPSPKKRKPVDSTALIWTLTAKASASSRTTSSSRTAAANTNSNSSSLLPSSHKQTNEDELPPVSDIVTAFVEDNDGEPDDKYIKLEPRALFLEDNITPPHYHGDFNLGVGVKDDDDSTNIDADSPNRRRHTVNNDQR